MQKTTRWIVIGASGTLGLGLIAGGALTAANAFEIRDANGVTVETVPEGGWGVSSDVSPSSEPATPTSSDSSDTVTPTPTASPATATPASPATVTPPSPVTPATPASPASPASVG